jgi:RND family efflux transporter MFP subunit
MLLPGFAAVGIAFAVAAAFSSERSHEPAQPLAQPSQAPYQHYVGGAGLVEANNNNISLGTSVAGVVSKVFVEAGNTVDSGQALFTIDDREALAEIAVKEASLAKAKAALEEARASHKDYQTQFALVKNVTDRRAVSVDDLEKRRNAEALAKAKVESAKAAVQSAEAELAAAKTTLERLTVRAPIACEVLQVNVRSGEFAATGSLTTPLMRLGRMDHLNVRVDIDENDAWRVAEGTRAMAFMRGNRNIKANLYFVRVEPYVTPKVSLTGSSSERVDTRVLQVIYSFDRREFPAFVGQQLDVFIETPAASSVAAGAKQATGGGS